MAFSPDASPLIYIAGKFSTIFGVAHKKLVRCFCSGGLTIDTSFPDLNIDGDGVYKVLVDAGTGDILIFGQFTSVGGKDRKNMARIKGDGTVLGP